MRLLRLITAMIALMLIAAACGSDDAEPVSSGEPAVEAEETDTPDPSSEVEEAPDEPAIETPGDFPLTFESAAGTFTLEAAPERIVSLNPAATEILFAVGAGDQVVAVDEFSYYPAEAPVTDLSGFDPNVEAITAYEPDLVIIAFDANDLVAGLTELEIPVLLTTAPIDIEGGYEVMAELGRVTGHADETAEAIAALRVEIADALAIAPEVDVRVYHELDDTYYSASSFGFIGAVYAELGASNIADAADTDQLGFPQLTEEYIVEADPELIVITDLVGYTPEDVLARPGWSEISAVANNRIVVVSADVASRWGPRLPQLISAVAEALASMEPVS